MSHMGFWVEGAACSQTDPEAFHPRKGDPATAAKQVCMGCDVRQECLDFALKHEMRSGIWGGKTPRERSQMKRRVA